MGEDRDELLAAGTRVGNFWVRGLLGQGAMGQVYLAQDVMLGRRVALKLIKRSVMERYGVERFLEEARATASFNHPHIVTLHAYGEHDGRPYLALEYIDGESLRVRLRSGPLPLREALRYGRAVAEAIAEAHRCGVVHADLKPENIVIPGDGRVRVVDFGLAKLAGHAHPSASGTPAYMAPECWRSAPPTGAIDVWALGVTLYEMVTGGRPIRDEARSCLASTQAELALLGLPDAMWAQLVRDCLAINPAARPTAEELVHRLTALLDPRAAEADDSVRAHVVPRATRMAPVAPHPAATWRGRDPGPLHPATGELLEVATGSRDGASFRREAAFWLARHVGAEAVLVAPISGLTRDAAGLVGLNPAWLDRLVDGFGDYVADFAQIAIISRRWRGFSRARDTDLEYWAGRYGRTGFHEDLVFPTGMVTGTSAVLEVRQVRVGTVLLGRERSSRRFTHEECDLLNGILPILAMGAALHASVPVGPISGDLREHDEIETRGESYRERGRGGACQSTAYASRDRNHATRS